MIYLRIKKIIWFDIDELDRDFTPWGQMQMQDQWAAAMSYSIHEYASP